LIVDIAMHPQLPGASIIIDGKGYSMLTVDGISAGEPHRVVVGAPGYTPQQFTVTGGVGDKKHLDVTLMKLDPHAKDKPPKDDTAAAPPSGTGKIAIAARGGWCNVTIDGAGRGATPVAGITMSAGPHSVSCTTDSGKTMSATVNVPADGVGRYAFTIPQ
jgi:hypothetical protein